MIRIDGNLPKYEACDAKRLLTIELGVNTGARQTWLHRRLRPRNFSGDEEKRLPALCAAGADGAEIVVGKDAGGVAVGERDLDGVVADLRGGLRAGLGLKHGKRGEWRGRRRELALLVALFVACGAGAVLAEIGEVVVAGVAVGPSDVNSCAGRDVDLYAGGFAALVEGERHGKS